MSIIKNLISTLSSLTLGKSITESMRIAYGPFSFQKYRKSFSRYRKIKQAMRHDLDHFFSSQRFYLENFIPQSTPLCLISHLNQLNSSLLLHYLDGHTELNVFPIKLNLNQNDSETWPNFKLDHKPDCWFNILFDPVLSSLISKGFSNSSISRNNYPFVFSSRLQKALFINYFSLYKVSSKREIFDTYFSSFFVAWLNNQNISFNKKNYNIISSRLSLTKESANDFFEIYPDGRWVLILCDPTEWLQSKLSINLKFSPVNHEIITNLLKVWANYINIILDAKQNFAERVCIISNADLIKNVKNVMLYLSKFLHIDYNDILLSTTYNTIPIYPECIKLQNNEVFNKEGDSKISTLTGSDFQTINELTEKVYKSAIQNLDTS